MRTSQRRIVAEITILAVYRSRDKSSSQCSTLTPETARHTVCHASQRNTDRERPDPIHCVSRQHSAPTTRPLRSFTCSSTQPCSHAGVSLYLGAGFGGSNASIPTSSPIAGGMFACGTPCSNAPLTA